MSNVYFDFLIKLLCFIDNEEDEKTTTRILRHIELIDDEAVEYGIKVVKCNDLLMAKKYGYRNPPGITYFRKGLFEVNDD